MNQEDFRRLVASGGGGSGSGSGSSRGDGGGGRLYGGKRQLTDADLAEIKKLSKRPKKKLSKKPASKGGSGDTDAGDVSADAHARYRDRAAERRQGVKNGGMVDADAFAHLDTEQSKFLGGDLEHTHLVKGLDFALLAQLKREKEKLQKATEDAKRERSMSGLSSSSSSGEKPAGKMSFTSRMGRLVYFHACQSAASGGSSGGRRVLVTSELFLPGRMDYTFNLSALELESIPVSIQRSKEDCPEPDDVANGIVDEALIARIGELLHRAVPGKKMRRKKREHERHAHDAAMDHEDGQSEGGGGIEEGKTEADRGDTSAVTAEKDEEEEDENIFSDVDEYVPVDQRDEERSEARGEKEKAITSSGYFSNLSASISAKEAAEREKEQEQEQAWKVTLEKAVAAQSRKEREEAQRARAEKLAAMTSEYDEYYASQAAGDSDEEESASGEGKKRRKATAGGDAEVDDAERNRRKQQKHSNRLQNDLEKINQIMATKRESRDG